MQALAEFGVVFLLFVIGIELKPSRLWVMRRSVFGRIGFLIFASLSCQYQNALRARVVGLINRKTTRAPVMATEPSRQYTGCWSLI